MLLSDAIGSAAGILLLVQPVRDQMLRYQALLHKRTEDQSPAPKLREVLRNVLETRRNEFSGLDSLATALGGAGLVACFVLKMFER